MIVSIPLSLLYDKFNTEDHFVNSVLRYYEIDVRMSDDDDHFQLEGREEDLEYVIPHIPFHTLDWEVYITERD